MKNYDPPMHTAEHILNQTMVRMFDCGRCFSAHINRKKSKCDYHFNRELSDKEIHEIETRVNHIIHSDLSVTEEFLSYKDALTEYNLERIPGDAGDRIRIIKVGNYDACPCIGPHVENTAQIPSFRIVSTGFENNVLRIRFKLEAG